MAHIRFSKPDLLFDVDGVLIYPQMRFRDYLERHHGITSVMTSSFFRGRFNACLTGQADLHLELGRCLDNWGWQGTVQSFIETWMREDTSPDSAMLDLVASMTARGFRCHIASVQERNRATYLRQTIGFERLFSETFFSCDIGNAKPDEAFYTKVQTRLSRPPQELFLVDDSRECIDAAIALGWQAFHYQGPDDQPRLAAKLLEFDR